MSEEKAGKSSKAGGKPKKARSRAAKPRAAKKKVTVKKKVREVKKKVVRPAPAALKPRRDIKQLLALRSQIAQRRPRFVRQESWRYKRLKENWRRPRGIDSKMRMHVKGWPKIVRIGYRGPKVVRGLHSSGLKDVLVRSIIDLERLNPQTDAARLASGLGRRKRVELFAKAKALRIRVLNPSRVTPLQAEKEA